jgi:pentatricopeptide repeat protein
MANTGGNALFVLRMILQRQASVCSVRSRFSTAVIDRERGDSKSSAWSDNQNSLFPGLKALASRSTPNQDDQVVDFLETESTEYDQIKTVLPARDLSPRPIPWPTIFAHPDPSTSTQPRARLCDPVARLVGEGDLASAQKIYHELRSQHIPIQARFVYLEAASQCLDARDTEGFLFWLKLYPNRPATRNHPELKATWGPLTTKVLLRHATDLDFLEAYLVEGARKGLLPVIVRPMMQHLTFVANSTRSQEIFEAAFAEYLANTTPKESNSLSDQGERHKMMAEGQVGEWWRVYRKMCSAQGWLSVEEAGYELSIDTATRIPSSTADPATTSPLSAKRRDLIAFAIDHPPPAKELAGLIWDIHCGTPDKVDDLRQAFVHHTPTDPSQITPSASTRQILWTRAIMIMHARVKNHQNVIEAYQDNFTWYGLPDHPLRRKVDVQSEQILIYPRKTVITTLMPSLLATLDAAALVDYHRQYLDSSTSLPPALQPDGHVHNTFISEITHRISIQAGMSAVETIIQHGYSPGSQSMTTLLMVYARKRMINEMFDLLESMERKDEFASSTGQPLGQVIPPPTEETYDWLVRILRNSDVEAVAMLKRMKEDYFVEAKPRPVEEERELETST